MADERKKRKTGLGIEAFFPAAEEEEAEETPAPSKDAPHKRPQAKRAKAKTEQSQTRQKPVEMQGTESQTKRRSAWLRENHMERLEALKLRERRRLVEEGKRASLTTLIDEAVERYLSEMET